MAVQLNHPVVLCLFVTSLALASPLHPRDVTRPNDHPTSTIDTPVQHIVQDIVEDIVITKQGDETVAPNRNDDDNLDNDADSKMDAVLQESSPVVQEKIEIRTHEDEEIVPGEDEDSEGFAPGRHREVDEMFVEPLGQEYVLVSVDDLMDFAESGLVFRPKFRYSGKSRRVLGRTQRRRTGRSNASF